MTTARKHPPAPRATTTHEPMRAGHDWSAGPWKYPPQPVQRPWLESDLAMCIACAVVVMLIWWMADTTWTAIVTEPGVEWE